MTDELQDGMIARSEELMEGKEGEKAVETASELVEISEKDAIAWFVKGKALYVADRFDDALACFGKSAEIKKEQPEVWQMMGYTLIALRRYKEAADALEYVKSADPKNVEAIYALGITHIILGDKVNGEENIKLAFAIDRKRALGTANNVYENYFSTSSGVVPHTRALIERALETLKLKG